jgi:hypothetical protein
MGKSEKKIDHLENPGLSARIILGLIFMRCYVAAWIEFIWLRAGTGCELIYMM